uniref:separase n=1 Tax=Strigamia maritima TaxID=126957 RepID=T1IUX7_STRMM
MEPQILNGFKKSTIGNGKTFELIKDHLNLNLPEEWLKVKFIATILKECCYYLKSISSELSAAQLSELSNIVDECFKNINQHGDLTFKIEKCLFYIMSDLIKFNHNAECLKVARHTIGQFKREIGANKLNVTPDLELIVKNCYLLLWNHGVKLSQEHNFEECSLYFLYALECLSYVTPTINDIIYRAIKATSALADYSHRLRYFKYFNDLILNILKVWPNIPESEIPETLHFFHKWNRAYAFALRKDDNNSSWPKVMLQSTLLLDKFAYGIIISSEMTPILGCSKCVELLTCGLEIFSKPHFIKSTSNKTFTKTYLHLERIFSKTFVLQNKTVHQFAIDISRVLLECIPEITQEVEANMSEDLLVSLKTTYFFHLHLLSVLSDKSNLQASSFDSITILQNLYHLYMRLAKGEILFSLVITDAIAAIPKISHFADVIADESMGEKVANLGLILANMGTIAYSKNFYADAIPFLKESCNVLLKWCKQGDNRNEIYLRLDKVNLENKHSMLIACLRKTHELSRCMKILMDIIPVYSEASFVFISYWILVQNEMKSSNSHYVRKTIREGCKDSKVSFSDDELFRLLQLELQGLKQQKYETFVDKYHVILAMRDVAVGCKQSSLNTAITLLELIQNQWSRPCDDEKSAKCLCEEALSILNDVQKESKYSTNAAEIKILLARGFYWQYLIELRASQKIVQDEMSERPVIEPKPFGQPTDEEGDFEADGNFTPDFNTLTVKDELESFTPLNRAMNLWTEIIVGDIASLSSCDQILIELQTAAEIYSLAKLETSERKAWVLARQLSSRYNCNATYVICTSRLVRLLCSSGDTKEVPEILKSCEKVLPKLKSDKTEHIYAYLRFQLAYVEFSYCVKDEKGGLKILSDVWNHPFLEKKSRFSLLIGGELKVIAGHFTRLPAVLHETKINSSDKPWGTSNAIELVLQGAQYFLKLVKEMQEGDFFTAICHYVISLLMNTHMLLVQMFIEIGATREARWFLKEQFNNSHRLVLGIRMSEFLFGLARLDLVCDNEKECLWKLQTLQYVLGKGDEPSTKFTKADSMHLSKLKVCIPQYLGHSTECNCSKCQTPILRSLALQILHLYVEHTAVYGSVSDALQLSRLAYELSRHNLTKYSTVVSMAEARLNTSRLLTSQNNYTAAISMIDKSIKQLEALPYACLKLAVILPELIYQKCICSLNASAAHHSFDVLNLVDSLWSLNRKNDAKIDDDAKIRNRELANVRSTPRQPFSPKQDILRTVDRDRSLLPRNLMNAPERKSRREMDRWTKHEEPGSDEDENTPQKKPLVSSHVFSFDIENTLPDEDDSNEGEMALKIPDFVLLPVSEQANFETTRGRISRSTTKCEPKRKVKPMSDEDYVPKSVKKNVTFADSGRVTRSRRRLMTSEENSENFRSNLEDEKNLSLNMDSEMNVSITLENEDPEEFAIDCDVPVIEIMRGGKGVVKKKTVKTEEVELPRNVEERFVKEKSTLDFACVTNVESMTEKNLKLNVIIEWLEKALSFVSHHPIYPLYPNLCFLLALLKGPKDPLCSYYLSESTFITLRHQCIINLGKKLTKKLNMEENSTRLANYYNTLNFTSATADEKKKNLDDHIKCLPEGWSVCQISFIPDAIQKIKRHENQPLVLTKFQKRMKPIVARVPTATYKPVEGGTCTFLEEFERINEANRDTMKSDNRNVWWDKRRKLNLQLKDFVEDLENVWIGHWKGLLLGRPISRDDQQRLSSVTQEILDAVGNKCNVDKDRLEMFLDSTPWLTREQLQLGMTDLFGFKENSVSADELINLIKIKMKPIKSSEINRHPLILILGKEIECLPWESMPIIRDNSVSRMPSLCLLEGHLSWQISQSSSVFMRGVDTDKTYFILNPSDDLFHTQATFEDWFKNTQKWPGVIGRPPTEDEFSNGLTLHDLFIYCGHGSGGKYLSGDVIQRLYCSAVALLMGCSSGKLRSLGRGLEPTGTVLQYLLAGCPSIVADLWDVTDRDIDRFLESLLTLWMESEGENLCKIIPTSRSVCRLPYLIGAAPVTYGLPVDIKSMQ